MKLATATPSHLCYCTNIHPGETWTEVRHNIEHYVTEVKRRVAPNEPFGVGLRLSAAAVESLAEEPVLQEFKDWLDTQGLYVFTINAFPFGDFHGVRVKENVYRPDWREPERVSYTAKSAQILARLIEGTQAHFGSVSTVPIAFRSRVTNEKQAGQAAEQILQTVAALAALEDQTGKRIVLALEPEPRCHIETTAEAVRFFELSLLAPDALSRFAQSTGRNQTQAEDKIRRHLGLCFDTCHAAVQFEDPIEAIGAIRSAGIEIAKVQLSAGLIVDDPRADATAELERFADDVYLHQVVEKRGQAFNRFVDLPDAIESLRSPDTDGSMGSVEQWRVHFHVPLFMETLGRFRNTQRFLAAVLSEHAQTPISEHLEVETYTWHVLPAEFRDRPVERAIERELAWVLEQLAQ